MNLPNRGRFARPLVASLGAFVLGGLMTPAVAETAAADVAASAGGGTEVETVIVTARRRSEDIQQTPVAVTAVAPSQLKNAAAPDIRDLAGRAPSLVVDVVNAGPSAAALSIRGISFEDIEKSFDPAVGVLVDDVYIGTNTGQLADTFDLQAVEVLRGPQGTLFGRNTIGGVIALTRTRPTGELGGAIDVVVGDYGRQEYKGIMNLPKLGDMLSTKLFFNHRQFDGYNHNVTLNKRTPGTNITRYGVDLLLQPTDAFDLNLTIEHARERSHNDQAPLSDVTDLICTLLPFGPGGSLIYLGPPFQPPASECGRNNSSDLYTTFTNKEGVLDNDEDDVTAKANWRIGTATLTSITGYRRNEEHAVQDFDSVSINFFDTVRDQTYRQWSQEFRLSGKFAETVDFVMGAYYFDSQYVLDQTTNFGPLLQAVGQPPQAFQHVHHTSKSYAGFADIDWQFAENWRLSVGGRYTQDKKHLDNAYIGAFATHAGASWSKFTPKVSIDYRPTSNVMLYASYSQGFRSGGFNGRAGTPLSSVTPYNPETVDAYEAGAKTAWLDHRLIFNVAVFDTRYKNKQEEVVQNTPPGSPQPQETLVANAASAKIYGAEFEVQAQPIQELSLRGSLSLMHAEYDRFLQVDAAFPSRTDDLSTLHLRRAPKVTFGAGFDYRHPVGPGTVMLTADYRYIAARETTISRAPGTGIWTGAGCATNTTPCTFVTAVNEPRGHAQANNLIDASVSYEAPLSGGEVRVSLFGRNLADERHLGGALAVAGLFSFGGGIPPRTWGVELGYRY